jgi:hypothetical protein
MGDDRSVLWDTVKECEWSHIGIGIIGNPCFFIGGVFFLFAQLKTPEFGCSLSAASARWSAVWATRGLN